MMRRPTFALAVTAALGLGACGPSSLPAKRSDRPLTMPSGEHQVVLGTGFTAHVSEGDVKSRALTPGAYRYGITNHFELRILSRDTGLLGVAYRLAVGDAEVRVDAGFQGFVRNTFRAPYQGDPRESLSRSDDSFQFIQNASLRRRLTSRLSTVADVRSRTVHSSLYGTYFGGILARASLVYDARSDLLVALTMSGSDGRSIADVEGRTQAITIGGMGLDGRGALIAYSPARNFDVLFAPFVTVNVTDSLVNAGTTFALDLHWD